MSNNNCTQITIMLILKLWNEISILLGKTRIYINKILYNFTTCMSVRNTEI